MEIAVDGPFKHPLMRVLERRKAVGKCGSFQRYSSGCGQNVGRSLDIKGCSDVILDGQRNTALSKCHLCCAVAKTWWNCDHVLKNNDIGYLAEETSMQQSI
jgi:hypothetical protein